MVDHPVGHCIALGVQDLDLESVDPAVLGKGREERWGLGQVMMVAPGRQIEGGDKGRMSGVEIPQACGPLDPTPDLYFLSSGYMDE
jgi:hypothetical protein